MVRVQPNRYLFFGCGFKNKERMNDAQIRWEHVGLLSKVAAQLFFSVFSRWTRQITWARRRCTGLPAAVTCRPAGCYWAPAPTRCCRRSRDCRRLSWAMRACRRYCRVSWRTVVGGSLLWAFIAFWTSASVLAEGVLIGNSEADRQLLEASKTGDLETVKVRAHCEGTCGLVAIWDGSMEFK